MRIVTKENVLKIEGFKSKIFYLSIIILTFILLFTRSPFFIDIPHRDSGVFLYFGQQILNGDIPYRDLWDHKPPLIYYVNALGLLLTGGSMWGIWALKSILLAITIIIGYKLIESVFGVKEGIISIFLFLTSLASMIAINYTEEWALFFQISGLYVFWKAITLNRNILWFVFGVTLAASFLLKPNMIGIYISIIIILGVYSIFNKQIKVLINSACLIGFGASSLFIPIILYFYLKDSLPYLIDQVFTYNSVYTSVTMRDKIIALIGGFSVLGFISYIALIAWCFIALEIITKKEKVNLNNIIIYVALIAFPIEIILSTLSGRSYEHYYVPWLAVSIVLIGYITNRVVGLITDKYNLSKNGSFKMLLVALIISLPNIIQAVPNQVSILINRGISPQADLINYITEETKENDYVLMWGAESSINFVTNRRSPTKFVYQYPIYTVGYQSNEIIVEFLEDIEKNKPKIIVDASSNDNWIPPINEEKRIDWEENITLSQYSPMESMEQVYSFIDTNYIYSTTLGGWDIYTKKE